MSKLNGDPGYRGGWCVHYRAPKIGNFGPGHEDCEAGVPFATVRDTAFNTRPCFLDNGQSKPTAIPCEHLRRPTLDEIAAHDTWAGDRMAQFSKVLVGIMPWREAHEGKSASEIITCPACGGKLHLSIAASNGHVHGKCETAGCVSWME